MCSANDCLLLMCHVKDNLSWTTYFSGCQWSGRPWILRSVRPRGRTLDKV